LDVFFRYGLGELNISAIVDWHQSPINSCRMYMPATLTFDVWVERGEEMTRDALICVVEIETAIELRVTHKLGDLRCMVSRCCGVRTARIKTHKTPQNRGHGG